MIVTKYERKFKELSKFTSYMILNEATKKQRFLNGLNEDSLMDLKSTPHHLSVQ